jgi:hypothetical protein
MDVQGSTCCPALKSVNVYGSSVTDLGPIAGRTIKITK